MSATDHHFLREDRATKWRNIAAHIHRHPEDLSIALENIDRWLKLGRVHPQPILEWREMISSALLSPSSLADLIRFLEEPNHDDTPLKSCSPFVGITVERKNSATP